MFELCIGWCVGTYTPLGLCGEVSCGEVSCVACQCLLNVLRHLGRATHLKQFVGRRVCRCSLTTVLKCGVLASYGCCHVTVRERQIVGRMVWECSRTEWMPFWIFGNSVGIAVSSLLTLGKSDITPAVFSSYSHSVDHCWFSYSVMYD